MAIRFIQPRRIRKAKSQGSQEVLHRLEEYLKTGCDEPVEILCGFWRDQQDAITYQELREVILDEELGQQALQEWSHDYSVLIAGKLSGMWTDAIAAGPSGQPVLDGLAFTYDMDASGIRNWIRERGAEFVTSCTKEQKNAISALLSKKMRDCHTVDELSRMIRPCIGLTEGQAKANARYYDSIVANLRKEHPRMKPENIRRKARDASLKYAERQHRQRAMTIARTESAFAYNRGADEGVRQAQEQGLLGKMVKRWSTSGDDAVCAICSALEGTEVGMDESFDFRGKLLFVGQKMLPPAHPRCACAVEYIEVEKPIAGAESPTHTGNTEIDVAIDAYDLSLVYTNGDEAMSTRLLLSHDNVKYVENNKLGCAFMYDTTKDAIMYNRNAEHWEKYNKIYVLTHENAHRVDYLELKSWQNTAFRHAIDATSELILSNKDAIKILLQNESYANDFAFNDIISGLTRGLFNDILFVGHSKEYYKSDKLQAMEILANLAYVDMSDSVVKTEFNGVLKSLYDAYKEVVKWQG